MPGPELNGPAVSFATLAAGVMTLVKQIPDVSGSIASIFAAMLAYQLWKNKRLDNKLKSLEIEKLENEMHEDS